MNFLKRLFGGGSGQQEHLLVYIRPKMCSKVIRVEVDLRNELSLRDSGDGYFVRKIANEPRCPFEVEVLLYFDQNRRLINQEIINGTSVTEEDYLHTQNSGQNPQS